MLPRLCNNPLFKTLFLIAVLHNPAMTSTHAYVGLARSLSQCQNDIVSPEFQVVT